MRVSATTRGGVFYVELISTDALRQYMKYRGYSIKGLADRIGVSKATIGHLHSGGRKSVGPEIAKNIERALDAPIGSLFLPKVSPVMQTREQQLKRAA